MKIRFATALFALALPVMAQDAASLPAESLFYKAYWLEKGERNPAEAMVLYEQFLQQAPDHRLAKQAATFEFDLLTRAGKTKEAEVFAKKYQKLLGDVAVGAPAKADGAGRGGEGRERGGDRGGERGAGGDMQARMAELKKQIEDAKAAGETEKVAQLEQRLKRMEQMGQGGGAGGRGQGGPGGRGGFRNNPLFGTQKLADLSADELAQFKEGLANMEPMLERMKQRLSEEQVKSVEESMKALKTALDGNKIEDAQKAIDKLRENMPRRGGRGGEGGGGGGEGGGEGGGRRPGGGGGGGGN